MFAKIAFTVAALVLGVTAQATAPQWGQVRGDLCQDTYFMTVLRYMSVRWTRLDRSHYVPFRLGLHS